MVGNYWLGRQAFDCGQYTNAESYFNITRALDFRPETRLSTRIQIECQHFQARLLYQKKLYLEADSLFRELAQELHDSGDGTRAADNQFQLAQSLLAQSKHKAARLAYRTVLDGGFEGKLVPNVISQSHYFLGRDSYRREAYQEAVAHFDQALNHPGGVPNDRRCRIYLGRSKFYASQFEDAKEIFHSLLLLPRPADHWACEFWLGKSLFELEDFDSAIEYLQAADKKMRINPDPDTEVKYSIQYHLGRAQFRVGEYSGALSSLKVASEYYDKAKSLTRRDECQYYMGLTSAALGKFVEARILLTAYVTRQESLNVSPTSVDLNTAKLELGRCPLQLGTTANTRRHSDDRKAWEYYRQITPFYLGRLKDGDRTIVSIQYDMGFIAFRLGDFEEAVVMLQAALTNNKLHGGDQSSQCEGQQCLATALWRLGRYDEAASAYEEALEMLRSLPQLCPTSVVLQENLGWQEQILGAESPEFAFSRLRLAHAALITSRLDLAEENYSLGLAVLERSRDEGKVLPERLARHHASFALTLLKLERPDDAKLQALQAIHGDGLEGIKDWIEVPRFADAFAELLPSSQIASMSEDRSESVPVKHMNENLETGDEEFGTPHEQARLASTIEKCVLQENTPRASREELPETSDDRRSG
ncbi:hypothetical protein F5Y19DRAFT_469292 [Xylariaceae sp. FL1651]|nr:hypothetical protein F5Y19DRAFT_469292 [Xylariaceae sp. FL1651]